MSRDGFRPVNDSGSRSGDALARLDEAAKQLELAMADADGKWQEAAIGALRADLASLQGFETAADRAEPRFGPQFHEEVGGDD